MSDQEHPPPIIEDPDEWARYEAEHEMPEEERVKLTAELVEKENQEAPTEEE